MTRSEVLCKENGVLPSARGDLQNRTLIGKRILEDSQNRFAVSLCGGRAAFGHCVTLPREKNGEHGYEQNQTARHQ